MNRFCFTAAQMPRGMEMTTVARIDSTVSSSVAGSLDTKVWKTFFPET